MICHAAETLPTVLLGDPLQAIFNWRGNEPPDWDGEVCRRFPVAGELQTPWRWINAKAEPFGRWLLDMRKELTLGRSVDLGTAPEELEWVRLDGTDDEAKRRTAARIRLPDGDARVIILGDNRPATHRRIASQTPGAITVEAVDLRDLVDFAKSLCSSRCGAPAGPGVRRQPHDECGERRDTGASCNADEGNGANRTH